MLKKGKTLFKGGHHDGCRDHCNRVLKWQVERLGLILNIAWASRDLYPRSSVWVSGWKTTKRNISGKGFLAKLT